MLPRSEDNSCKSLVQLFVTVLTLYKNRFGFKPFGFRNILQAKPALGLNFGSKFGKLFFGVNFNSPTSRHKAKTFFKVVKS